MQLVVTSNRIPDISFSINSQLEYLMVFKYQILIELQFWTSNLVLFANYCTSNLNALFLNGRELCVVANRLSL